MADMMYIESQDQLDSTTLLTTLSQIMELEELMEFQVK
jgi:hypothetical protein